MQYDVVIVRLVMMGNEGSLRSIADKIRDSIEGAFPVDVIGLDMEADNEEAFDVAVQKAWSSFGNFDAFLNSYVYQGSSISCFLNSGSFITIFTTTTFLFLQGRSRTFCKCLKMSSRESQGSISRLHGFS